MSSPIQKIKSGLINGDLKEIAEGYSLLTGEDIQVSDSVGRYSFQKMVDILFDTYENYHGTTNLNRPAPIDRRPEPTPAPPPKKEVSIFGNKAVMVTEAAKESEVEKNKKIAVKKTKRKPKQTFTITCSICNNDFQSNIESTNNIGQRCNACLKKAINGKD